MWLGTERWPAACFADVLLLSPQTGSRPPPLALCFSPAFLSATLFDAVKVAYDKLSDPAQRATFDTERAAIMHQKERFKKMDAQNQQLKTSLEERERAAEERAKAVYRKTAAKELAAFRAANRQLVENMVEAAVKERSARSAAAAGAGGAAATPASAAAVHLASAGAGAGADAEDADPAATLELKEKEVFLEMELAKRRRKS